MKMKYDTKTLKHVAVEVKYEKKICQMQTCRSRPTVGTTNKNWHIRVPYTLIQFTHRCKYDCVGIRQKTTWIILVVTIVRDSAW